MTRKTGSFWGPIGWLGCGAVALVLGGMPQLRGVSAAEESGAVGVLVRELAVQQEQIMANQAQIEERLARVAEDVRVARLFSARAGGKTAP